MSLWIEAVVALLLVASGLLAVTGALGLLRLRDFFQRMHPPALANTLAAWCAALASVGYFSALASGLVLYPLVINVLLAITAPVTTVLLARAALLRKRAAGAAVPPPLGERRNAPANPAAPPM
jgi:multicomponent K+:H+ antiporter subunit G